MSNEDYKETVHQAHSDATDLVASIEALDKLCLGGGAPAVPLSYDDLHSLLGLIEGKARLVLDTLT